MTEKEKMISGRLYCAQDETLRREHASALRLTRLFNRTTEEESARRGELLRDLFASVGKNVTIEPTFRCDYGRNIHIGDNFFANFDCIILDVCTVTIGSDVLFGPRVSLYTAAHPLDAEVRRSGLEYGQPIHIGDTVWIGGNAVINPGVSIGARSIIGSGSVVTKDIPPDVVAAGNPCRVIRAINDTDRAYWKRLRQAHTEE